MIGIVVVTHGQLAAELLNAAEMIVGDLPRFTAVSIGWDEDATDAREEIAQAIARVQQGQGVLIMTDMFDGTPSNLAMTFLGQNDVEVITGVNLPMLIKLASLNKQASLLEAAREMREHGRNTIWVASELLRGEKVQKGEGGRGRGVTRVEKPWGYELHWAKTERYVGKILHVKAGHALSLQYHNRKDETIYLYSGKMLFEVEEDGALMRREMMPGDVFHVTPKTVHRMTAIDDCDILEVSTPELDDVVRLEDRYGRVDPK